MGLISRVSSRTYRFNCKLYPKWPNKTLPSPVVPERAEKLISTLQVTSDERSCAPASAKNSEDSTTSEACHSLKTMKSKSSEDTSKANKPEKSSPFTERSTLFTSNESAEKKPTVKPPTSASTHPTWLSLR